MKRFAALSLAALMILTVFASAASAQDVVEIRGPVYNGSTLSGIIADQGGISMDATNFAAFYYDLDDDVTTETLNITAGGAGADDRVIGEGALTYRTEINEIEYEYENWGNFSMIGFFAEKYIPLKPTSADKLAKLILDSDDKYTIRTGEQLELGEGYTIEAKQVDVDGEKVWLEFQKDGEFVDDEIISVVGGNATWTVDLDDIQDEDDVVVLKVNVNQVFQGAVDSIAQIEGLWLIDYANAMTIESDDEFGELNDVTLGDTYIQIKNEDSISLTKDDDVEIGQGLFFKVADSNDLRFYAMKEYTEPGTYEIRGKVATGPTSWNATSFAGFFYDLNDNVQTESLIVEQIDDRDITENSLKYRSSIEKVDYEYEGFGQYPVMGLFAKKYIPITGTSPDKLAKLILDSDDKYTIRTGEQLELGEGYTIEAKQVDVDGEKVWLEFQKDGEFVDDEIISVAGNGSNTWTVDLDDIQDEDDVVVLKVNVNQVFQGAVDSIAQIEGLWLIDYANAMTIESDDEFGDLDDVSIGNDYIEITNEDSISLTRDDDVEIGEGMFFKVADANELRYYPYVEVTLGNETISKPDDEVDENATEVDENATEVDENATEVDENATEGVTEPTEGETEATEEPTEEEPGTPGFGVVLGLVGLLAVVYLVRRNN